MGFSRLNRPILNASQHGAIRGNSSSTNNFSCLDVCLNRSNVRIDPQRLNKCLFASYQHLGFVVRARGIKDTDLKSFDNPTHQDAFNQGYRYEDNTGSHTLSELVLSMKEIGAIPHFLSEPTDKLLQPIDRISVDLNTDAVPLPLIDIASSLKDLSVRYNIVLPIFDATADKKHAPLVKYVPHYVVITGHNTKRFFGFNPRTVNPIQQEFTDRYIASFSTSLSNTCPAFLFKK